MILAHNQPSGVAEPPRPLPFAFAKRQGVLVRGHIRLTGVLDLRRLGHYRFAPADDHEARLLRTETDPEELYLEARAMLRTGRLAQGRQLLERRAAEEGRADPARPQRFHRETQMLLSLICAFQGDAAAAGRTARQGIATGLALESAFVQAVGHMRLGHALQIGEASPWQRDPDAPAGNGPAPLGRRLPALNQQHGAFLHLGRQVEGPVDGGQA